ncbi:hypothetical protein [Streptomyces sp. NPDC015130]|uniref:hypothetical protein n=1 Tax=Streptomyces sp. NPDC015130 TaxID=3364940 RepID=UPI0036F7F1C9
MASAAYAGLVSAMTLANELALGAAPPERAGSAAAVLESGQELGGALGMALPGSIGAAVYTAAMPVSAPAAARETLGGAGGLARRPRRGAVRLRLGHGGAALGAAVLMALAAVVSVVVLRGRS